MKLGRRDFLRAVGLAGAGAAVTACSGSSGPAATPAEEAAHTAGHTSDPGAVPVPKVSDASQIQHAKVLQAIGDRSVFPPFPGPAGEPGELDHLLYPPPAQPARPGRVREYNLVAQNKTIQIAKDTFFEAWTYNGHVPGPIIRATEGDTLRVTLRNDGEHAHSIHWHGVHPANQDGVFEVAAPGESVTYEFTAEPYGLYPYHCHTDPIDQHIARGLYGAMIVDPPLPRSEALELVMVMNGFDLNQDGENEVYTVNGIGMYYAKYPIQIKVGQLVRIYLVNMTEFDAVNTLHIHANMFHVFKSGTSLVPTELTDIVSLSQGERAIVEFTYKYPGRYMFHAHQSEFTMLGWMGFFDVIDDSDDSATRTLPMRGDPRLVKYVHDLCEVGRA
ncbi:MAG: multicopper oxidase domain-containing protein [Chloroflexi bacterium]|nr:multicopper oxidase domain-containing protein [Chloroflexota bacterium]